METYTANYWLQAFRLVQFVTQSSGVDGGLIKMKDRTRTQSPSKGEHVAYVTFTLNPYGACLGQM